jgi:DNA-binding protein YbaB
LILAGSAAFVLDGVTIEQLRKLKSVELVTVDFSGNEILKQIDIDPQWIKQAEDTVVVDRDFLAVGQETTWR